MRIREPIVAGQFYPADPNRCRSDLARLVKEARASGEDGREWLGGLVPHAGWVFSGLVAAKVFCTLSAARSPAVIVLFGGVHRNRSQEAALFADGRWETPIGPIEIDARLAERILGQTNLIVDDPFAHENEHSIEVQMPFVRHLFPEAGVVPIMVPPSPRSLEVGQAVARTISSYEYDALIVGTTDLTHYGPGYGFIPEGIGASGNTWAKEENDRRFIELTCALQGSEVVAEARAHHNACSSGAVAATLGAVAELGATHGVVLEHTTSSDIMSERTADSTSDSVGYAGIVFS